MRDEFPKDGVHWHFLSCPYYSRGNIASILSKTTVTYFLKVTCHRDNWYILLYTGFFFSLLLVIDYRGAENGDTK